MYLQRKLNEADNTNESYRIWELKQCCLFRIIHGNNFLWCPDLVF